MAKDESPEILGTEDKPRGLKNIKMSKKQIILVLVVATVIVVGAVVAFFIFGNSAEEELNEPKVATAAELESYKVADDASDTVKNAAALSNAWAYFYEQNYDKALELLETIVNPTEADTIAMDELYAFLYENLDQPEKAKEYFQKMLDLNEAAYISNPEGTPTAHFDLATLYEKVGDFVGAVEQYTQYIEAVEALPEDSVQEYERQLVIDANSAIERLR